MILIKVKNKIKRMKYLIYLFVGFLLLISSCSKPKILETEEIVDPPISTSKPNFIFYLADDQNQLDYGCYGNPNVSTFNIDKLSDEGMRFTNFYTAEAICAPARSQIYTGMYPVKSGAMANHIGVKPTIKSITSYLKTAGYEVVLAGKSHVKPDNVFDWTYFFESQDHINLPLEAIDGYLKNVKKPFCLILASDFPHGPYPATSNYTASDIFPLPYRGVNNPGYYQNIDDDNVQLGKILKMVDDYGLRDNSMFMYASDHGISGKYSLKEQGLKVPFVVRWPGVIIANTTATTIHSFCDVLPTFLEAANTTIPASIDGKSFLKTLKGDKQEVNEYIYGVSTYQNIRTCRVFPGRMVRDARFKLIVNYNSHEVANSNLGTNSIINEFIKIGANAFPNSPYEELYDLSVDPYQKNNLAKNTSYKTQKDKLTQALKTWMIAQNDFLLTDKMPLLKPTLNPLDEQSQWNAVPANLEGKLTNDDYIQLHY